LITSIDDGAVFTWGRNDDSQLGVGQLEDTVQRSPVEITSLKGKNIKDVAVGCFNSFALAGGQEETVVEPGMTLEDLENWLALRDQGKISEEAFQEKKRLILEFM
jgi:alpha-tubulin suppressor-like RCC1 family protein